MVKFFTAFSLVTLGLNPIANTKRQRERKMEVSVAKIVLPVVDERDKSRVD